MDGLAGGLAGGGVQRELRDAGGSRVGARMGQRERGLIARAEGLKGIVCGKGRGGCMGMGEKRCAREGAGEGRVGGHSRAVIAGDTGGRGKTIKNHRPTTTELPLLSLGSTAVFTVFSVLLLAGVPEWRQPTVAPTPSTEARSCKLVF